MRTPRCHVWCLAGLSLWLLATLAARATEHVYDLTIAVKAQTLVPDPAKVKVKVTGTMTYNDVTGEVSFEVTEDTGVTLVGEGLLGRSEKFLGIAQTTFDAKMESATLYTGSAFFVGKFSKDMKKFSGKFYGIANSFGDAPEGYTFNLGKVKAVKPVAP